MYIFQHSENSSHINLYVHRDAQQALFTLNVNMIVNINVHTKYSYNIS